MESLELYTIEFGGISLVVQGLRLHSPNVGGPSVNPGQRTIGFWLLDLSEQKKEYPMEI